MVGYRATAATLAISRASPSKSTQPFWTTESSLAHDRRVSSLCEAGEVGTVASEPEENLIMNGQLKALTTGKDLNSRTRKYPTGFPAQVYL
jgi:hypothetical protein